MNALHYNSRINNSRISSSAREICRPAESEGLMYLLLNLPLRNLSFYFAESYNYTATSYTETWKNPPLTGYIKALAIIIKNNLEVDW